MMEGQVKQSEADMQILGAFKNEQYLSLLFPSPPPPPLNLYKDGICHMPVTENSKLLAKFGVVRTSGVSFKF